MKTKYLLMTMALPAVFAACSNEDFMEQSTNPVADDGRELVGNVVLKTTFPGNPNTRLDWGVYDGIVKGQLEPGIDQIGAVQIDTYNRNRRPRFLLTDDINTNFNYWLEEENGEYVWKGATPLSEGNYLFYLNYNKDMLTRDGMYDVVDSEQYAQDDKGEYDKYNALNDQFYLGYRFLEPGEGTEMVDGLGIYMAPIHTRVGVKATFKDNGEVKIKKIAIRKADSDEGLEAFYETFSNGSIKYAPMTTRVDIKPATTQRTQGFLDEACLRNEVYQLKKNKDGVTITADESTVDDYEALMNTLVYPNWNKEYLTYQYEVNFPECEEATLSNGESVSAFILMPTCNFSRSTDPEDFDAMGEPANMVIAIYTDKGMFEVPMIADNLDVSGIVGNVQVNGDMEPMNAQRVAYYEVSFDNAAAGNTPKTFTVNNTADLMEHLNLFAGTSPETTLHLYAASSEVKMTQEVYDFLAKKTNIKLTLESGQLVIEKGINLKDGKSPLDLIYLNDEYEGRSLVDKIIKDPIDMDVPAPTIVVEGNYATTGFNYVGKSGNTLGNIIQEILQDKAPNFGITLYDNIAVPAIKVAEGGVLNVNASVAARVEVEEGGQLIVSGDKPIGLLSIANMGIANINSKFLAFHVFNGAVAQLNINADSEFSLFNDREVKLNENCCLDDENAFTWNWGKVTIAKDVEAYLFGLEYKGFDQPWYGNWGIIENYGEIKAGHTSNDFVNEPDEVVYCINSGRIINHEGGVIYDLYNNGYVDNDGTLYLAKTTKWSYIDITDSPNNVTRPNSENEDEEAQYIYKVDAQAATTIASLPTSVTKLVVASDLTVEKANGTVTTIILQDGAKLKGEFTNNNLRVIAEKGVSTLNGVKLAGKLWISSGAKVTVEKESTVEDVHIFGNNNKEGLAAGKLEVASNVVLTYNGKIDNYGEVNVLGNAIAGDKGTYNEFTGGKWNGNNDPRPLVSYEEFKTMLTDQVKYYISNTFKKIEVEPTYNDFVESVYNTDGLKEKTHQAEVDLEDEFNNLLSELRDQNVDALIKAFDGKTSSWKDSEVYGSAHEAYSDFRTKVISGEVENGIDALYRYSAALLTDEQVAAILEDYAPYRYVWKNNELDEVLQVMDKGWGQWTDVFGSDGGYSKETIEGVKSWLTDASKYEGDSEYGKMAKTVAAKYVGEFAEWDYSNDQVKAFNYKD